MKANLILAVAECGTIGTKDKILGKTPYPYLPWVSIREDMLYFSKITKTSGGVLVMGHKTWMTIPEKYRELGLPERLTVVLTRDPDKERLIRGDKGADTIITSNLNNLHRICVGRNIDTVWVAGGKEIYDLFLDRKIPGFDLQEIHRTLVHQNFAADEMGVALHPEQMQNFVRMPSMVDPSKLPGVTKVPDREQNLLDDAGNLMATIEVFRFPKSKVGDLDGEHRNKFFATRYP